MLTIIVVLFAIAALGGVTLAFMRLREKPLPMPLALVHGAVAAIALVLLIIAALGPAGSSPAKIAVLIFVVAALGGFYLFSFHVRDRKLPIPVVLIHGVAAVAGFATLLYAVFGR
jgi:hypothetical protein